MSFRTFFEQYLVTALWSSNTGDEMGTPLDTLYCAEDFDSDSLQAMRFECQTFYNVYWPHFDGRDSDAGHDFWLTRNGHGAGFWDGDWPDEARKILTDGSHRYGERDLYVGDDGQLYVFPPPALATAS